MSAGLTCQLDPGPMKQAFLSPEELRSGIAAWAVANAHIRFDVVSSYDSTFKVRSEKILSCEPLPKTDAT